MDVQESSAVIQMKRHLQKYVRTLISDMKEIEARETTSKKEVASLANLLEQRDCVARMDLISTTLASDFGDVQARLLVKISTEVDTKLNKLKDLIEPLRSHSIAAYRARAEALNLIRQNSNVLNICTLTSGQPTIPSLVVMLDWVDAVERQTREIYHIRMYYLENILDQEIANSENLVSLWTEAMPVFRDTVKDCEELATYFLEEKY